MTIQRELKAERARIGQEIISAARTISEHAAELERLRIEDEADEIVRREAFEIMMADPHARTIVPNPDGGVYVFESNALCRRNAVANVWPDGVYVRVVEFDSDGGSSNRSRSVRV